MSTEIFLFNSKKTIKMLNDLGPGLTKFLEEKCKVGNVLIVKKDGYISHCHTYLEEKPNKAVKIKISRVEDNGDVFGKYFENNS